MLFFHIIFQTFLVSKILMLKKKRIILFLNSWLGHMSVPAYISTLFISMYTKE